MEKNILEEKGKIALEWEHIEDLIDNLCLKIIEYQIH